MLQAAIAQSVQRLGCRSGDAWFTCPKW